MSRITEDFLQYLLRMLPQKGRVRVNFSGSFRQVNRRARNFYFPNYRLLYLYQHIPVLDNRILAYLFHTIYG